MIDELDTHMMMIYMLIFYIERSRDWEYGTYSNFTDLDLRRLKVLHGDLAGE